MIYYILYDRSLLHDILYNMTGHCMIYYILYDRPLLHDILYINDRSLHDILYSLI